MSSTIHSENAMASQILKCSKNQTKRLNHQNQSIGLKMLNTNGNPGYHGHHPAPTSVARRNERERNRVKMVNMGFATLRQHVPNGAKNKKMSKVETLRSAVEYIRELQKLLGTSGELIGGGVASPSSTTSSLSSSSSPNSNIENQCYMFDEQYLHVPTTSPDSNLNGATDLENCYSSSMTPTPRTPDIADISGETTGLGSSNTTVNNSSNTSLIDHPQYSSPTSLSLSGRLYSTSSYNDDNSTNNDNHIDENSPQITKHHLITAYMNIKEEYQLHPQPNHNQHHHHHHHHHLHHHHQDHHVTHHQSLSSPTPSIVSSGMNGSSTIVITQLNPHQNAHHHQQQIDVRSNGSSGANGEDEMFDFVDWF